MKIEKYFAPHQPVQEAEGWVVYAKEDHNVRLLTNGEMHEYCTFTSTSVKGEYTDIATAYFDTFQDGYAAAAYYIRDNCNKSFPCESTIMEFENED